jgi:hypothetical protein
VIAGRRASFVAALAFMTSAACNRNPNGRSKQVEASIGSASAKRLATLQVGGSMPPAPLVRAFDDVLTALEVRCAEARTSSPSLDDVAMIVVATAKARGHDISPLDALRTLEASIQEGADMKIECASAARTLAFDESQKKN